MSWRRKWWATLVFLPGESQGRRSMVGYSPWGRKESDSTEQQTHTQTHTHIYMDWMNSSWTISNPKRWCCESVALNIPANMENSAIAIDWKRSVFIPIPKKGNTKECSNYHTIALISHASKVMFKILQARLQHYMNHELPDIQAGFRKGKGTRDQSANICWIIEEARESQKNIHFCFIDYAKAFDCVDHNKLWKTLQEMRIPDDLTCLLRNLYEGQETIVRTGHGTTDWFQIRKGVHQGSILSPCLFIFYAE